MKNETHTDVLSHSQISNRNLIGISKRFRKTSENPHAITGGYWLKTAFLKEGQAATYEVEIVGGNVEIVLKALPNLILIYMQFEGHQELGHLIVISEHKMKNPIFILPNKRAWN